MSDLNWKGHLAMSGANLTWGLMSPVVKIVLASGAVAPMLLVDFRMAGAAVLFWITSLFMPREHVPARDKLLLCGAGMLGILFNQGCFILGVSMSTPSEASLVTTTIPMCVMMLAWLILREPIS
ncbi:MAG: DMT family transporter, partial [Muribaculaceae bacterium]|nr:DMT family transporter [Muribaculaceae bacterium]